MDADGSHQPEQLERLVDALRTADLVIGSRYVPGGSVVNWPVQRLLLSRGGNLYVPPPARHPRQGRDGRLPALPPHHPRGDRPWVGEVYWYVFQTDLAYRTVSRGLRLREVPIEFIERVRGDSKMSGRSPASRSG